MRKSIAAALVLFIFLMGSINVSANDRKKEIREIEHARSATAELFIMNPEVLGGSAHPIPICGAWNVAKVPGGYELFTAAHCIDIDRDNEATAPIRFGVSYDGIEHPILLPATIIAVGDQTTLVNDLALLYVQTNVGQDVLELSTETPKVLDRVINWSASYGHVMQASEGYIAATGIDDIPGEATDSTNWVVMEGVYKGSSGSAIISVKTGKVIEMVNIGVPLKGFAGVRASRMVVFLAQHLVTTQAPAGITLFQPSSASPNDQRSLHGGRF